MPWWICKHFITASDVHVSGAGNFCDTFQGWREDPCGRLQRDVMEHICIIMLSTEYGRSGMVDIIDLHIQFVRTKCSR